jgi:glycosyltransferase involved in cell wall biosynthesis
MLRAPTIPEPQTDCLSIAFLSPSVSRSAGGIFEIERRLAQSLEECCDAKVEVFGASDAFAEADAELWQPLRVNTFPYLGPQQFRWSPRLAQAFVTNQADVSHLHVLWMHTSIVMRRWAARHRRPYVTTLNGMLEPWALHNSQFKKRLSLLAYERNCLNTASCIQVNSFNELRSARAFGLKNPIAIIPNGIDLPHTRPMEAPWTADRQRGRRVLLFLGRLHPKKGIPVLLHAWKELVASQFVAASDWCLVIAGWSQGGHRSQLESLAHTLNVDEDVIFAGPLFNEAKTAAYQNANAIVLPSLSEGLPMAVLEAWSHSKPVLMTPQCNLPEGFAAGAAISAEPTVASMAEGLKELLTASDAERQDTGTRGLELVRRRFTWPRVAAEMHSVYSWLVGGGKLPTCVVQN